MANQSTLARPPKNSDTHLVPGIRTEEGKTRPRVERATVRFFDRIWANVDKVSLESALEDNDQRLVMVLFTIAAETAAKGLESVLGDAIVRAGKLTAKEINRQSEGDDEFLSE